MPGDARPTEGQDSVDRTHHVARIRLARTATVTVVLSGAAVAVGVWPGWVILIGGTILAAGAWDYYKRGHNNGGWISPPMGTLGAGHLGYGMSNQGDTLVDATGRNWVARRKTPTQEQIATGHGDDGPGLLVMLLGSAAFVGVALLIWWIAQ